MTNAPTGGLVLVTGGSGNVGSHCVLQLIDKGYTVRTTVRSQSRVEHGKNKYRHGGATNEQIENIEFAILDLVNDSDESWTKACAGVKFVMHTAGFIPTGKEKDVDELLVPLKDGTLRILRAAKAAGVQKVVFTSSVATIAHGHGPKRGKSQPFTEVDWTDLSDKKEKLHVYPRAKTIQEHAAWDYIKSEEGKGLEMTVINPVAIYGPSLSKEFASSLKLIGILLGGMPGVPQYGTGMVDVRDLADLHVKAMESPAANGQRYLAISGRSREIESKDAVCDFVSMISAAEILRAQLPAEKTRKIPNRTLPNFVMRAAGYFDPVVGVCLPDLGKELAGSFAKARRELDWKPRTVEEALLSSANSLIEFGVV